MVGSCQRMGIDGCEMNGEDDGQEAFVDVLYRTLLP